MISIILCFWGKCFIEYVYIKKGFCCLLAIEREVKLYILNIIALKYSCTPEFPGSI